MSIWVTLFRLLLACLLGGVIGLERESSARPAGFRTHVLVCLGATLITMMSITAFPDSESARVAAQIVSGIGFLGAGTIMREGLTVRGLTTAASLWVVAGIGIATGAGYYWSAIIATLLVFVALTTLAALEPLFIRKSRLKTVVVEAFNRPGLLGEIGMILGSCLIDIESVKVESGDNNDVCLTLMVRWPLNVEMGTIVKELKEIEDVNNVEVY